MITRFMIKYASIRWSVLLHSPCPNNKDKHVDTDVFGNGEEYYVNKKRTRNCDVDAQVTSRSVRRMARN